MSKVTYESLNGGGGGEGGTILKLDSYILPILTVDDYKGEISSMS